MEYWHQPRQPAPCWLRSSSPVEVGGVKNDSKMKNQWAVLDGLRFVLAFIVFFTHANGQFRLPPVLQHISDAGAFAAVLGFLVVSGYSIGASLSRDASPVRFYERRFSRIYPVYFAATLLACLPYVLWGANLPNGTATPVTIWPLIGNFFLMGGLTVEVLPTDPVAWSLVIECVYYLLAPLFSRQRSRLLVGLIGLSAILYWVHSTFGIIDFNQRLYGSYGVLALAWAWLLGFLMQRHPGDKRILTLGPLLGCLLLNRFDQYLGHFSEAVFVGSVVIVAWSKDIRLPVRVAAVLEYLGELSYPLYLVHVPLFVLVACAFPSAGWLVAVVAATGATLLLLHGVDLPYRAYARRVATLRGTTAVIRFAKAPCSSTGPYDTPKSVSRIDAPVPVSLPE